MDPGIRLLASGGGTSRSPSVDRREKASATTSKTAHFSLSLFQVLFMCIPVIGWAYGVYLLLKPEPNSTAGKANAVAVETLNDEVQDQTIDQSYISDVRDCLAEFSNPSDMNSLELCEQMKIEYNKDLVNGVVHIFNRDLKTTIINFCCINGERKGEFRSAKIGKEERVASAKSQIDLMLEGMDHLMIEKWSRWIQIACSQTSLNGAGYGKVLSRLCLIKAEHTLGLPEGQQFDCSYGDNDITVTFVIDEEGGIGALDVSINSRARFIKKKGHDEVLETFPISMNFNGSYCISLQEGGNGPEPVISGLDYSVEVIDS